MTKKHEAYRWCLLWQSNLKDEIDVIKEGLDFFVKKYGEQPDFIYIFKDGKSKSYDRIPTLIDKQLFHVGLVAIPLPIGIKTEI